MGIDDRSRAAETYVRALRSGEATAVRRLAAMLAPGAVLVAGGTETVGRDPILEHVTGQWPATPALNLGGYGEPSAQDDGTLLVTGEIHNLGAAPRAVRVRLRFDDHDKIVRVDEDLVPAAAVEPSAEIPLFVRALINGALAIGRPLVFAYVDEENRPRQSLRGSVQVFGPTQLCLWARPGSRVRESLERNPNVSLLYRDSTTRTTLLVRGSAGAADDEATRRRVFELAPEVEQRHDPGMAGSAVIVTVEELRGTTPQGAVTVRPRA